MDNQIAEAVMDSGKIDHRIEPRPYFNFKN